MSMTEVQDLAWKAIQYFLEKDSLGRLRNYNPAGQPSILTNNGIDPIAKHKSVYKIPTNRITSSQLNSACNLIKNVILSKISRPHFEDFDVSWDDDKIIFEIEGDENKNKVQNLSPSSMLDSVHQLSPTERSLPSTSRR